MAEFLIMARKHWSYKDKMTVEEQDKYDRMYQPGDIVQVYPDGACSQPCVNPAFNIIKIKGLAYEDALKYQEQLNEEYLDEKGETQTRMLKRRKFNIKLLDLPTEQKDTLTATKNLDNVEWKDMSSFVFDKVKNTEISLEAK